MSLATTSLRSRGNALADTEHQLTVLHSTPSAHGAMQRFSDALRKAELFPLRPLALDVIQVNIGKMCNQACKHCHVDAGPDRKEKMSRETMEDCLRVIAQCGDVTVDITGGAPEMHPDFRWFVQQVRRLGKRVMVRCNLTIIVANPVYHDLPEFFRENDVHVVSSLPFYDEKHTDRQRGGGVFADSMRAMTMLNAVGYGVEGTGLRLDLVYNPVGALLPGPQGALEADFKRELQRKHNVQFSSLICITNMPIARFLEFLIQSGTYQGYMEKLINAFNPAAAAGVMCRNTLSVGWDGVLYDCDFNQMLDLPVAAASSRTIRDFNAEALAQRAVVVDQHCFGCTAGAGSSCGGQLV